VAAQKKMLFLLAYSAGAAPNLGDLRDLAISRSDSVLAYLRDNTVGVIDFAPADIAGPFAIGTLPCAVDAAGNPARDANNNIVKTPRASTVQAAISAAKSAGANVDGYDATVVMLHPQVRSFPNGEQVAYDTGATGNVALFTPGNSHTYITHECSHTVGFIHSNGMLNTGSDWDGAANGWTHDFPYGDPYDLMSAEAFGQDGAAPSTGDPTFALPAFTGYPNTAGAGPMLARAQVWFLDQSTYESTGAAVIAQESGNTSVLLDRAGSGRAGAKELLVYHANGGTLLIELRVPGSAGAPGFWDSGLKAARSAAAVVIHRPADSADPYPGIWYLGRITLPGASMDTAVSTRFGDFTISVSTPHVVSPDRLAVTVRRGRVNHALMVREDDVTTNTVLSSVMKKNPDYPDGPEFSWQRVEHTLQATYTPLIRGVAGGIPAPSADSAADVTWTFDGANPPGAVVTQILDGDIAQVTNNPPAGHVALTLTATATDATSTPPTGARATGSATYEIEGITEGWGPDFFLWLGQRLKDKIHVKWPPDKPDPKDIKGMLDEIKRMHDELARDAPQVLGDLQIDSAVQTRRAQMGSLLTRLADVHPIDGRRLPNAAEASRAVESREFER
jgi:hypothetical protein